MIRTFLLSFSFFILVIWSVSKLAVHRDSYAIKIKTLYPLYLLITMAVTSLYLFFNMSADIVIGYTIGLSLAYISDLKVFDKTVKLKLLIRMVTSETGKKE